MSALHNVDLPNLLPQVSETSTISEYGFGLTASRDHLPDWDKSMFAQMGGEWIDDVMQIDSEAGHYWLSFYQRAMVEGVIDPDTIAFSWPDLIRNFAQGKAAMAQMSSNVYPKDVQPEIEFGRQWSINPKPITRPGGEAEARYITTGWPYLVSADTKYPYEVGLVLRYLASDEQALSVALRYRPSSNSRMMASPEYLQNAPWGEILIEPRKKLAIRPNHVNQAAMDGVIRDAMQEALSKPDADVAEMAKKYQQRLNDLAAAVPSGK